ncbi:MAG: hypothetical protein AAGI92_11765 [Pseudomonadota bacterium]
MDGCRRARRRGAGRTSDLYSPQHFHDHPRECVHCVDGYSKRQGTIAGPVIMEYLEDILPGDTPLRPTSPVDVAEVRAMLKYIDEAPAPAIRVPSYNLAFLMHFPRGESRQIRNTSENEEALVLLVMETG